MQANSEMTRAAAILATSLALCWAHASRAGYPDEAGVVDPVVLVEHDGSTQITATTPLGSSWYLSGLDKQPLPAALDGKGSRFQDSGLWLLNGGYQHNLSSQLSFFVEGGVARQKDDNQTEGYNFATGMHYTLMPGLALRSRISHITIEQNQASKLEVQGLYRLTNSVDVHASYDLEPEQQNLSLGLGFRF